MEFEKAIALIVLSLSLWGALALLSDRRGHAKVNRSFAFLILCFCIPQSYFYTRLISPPDGSYLLAMAAQAVIWLKGPLLFAMVRLAVGQSLHAFWRHFLPFPFALAGMLLWPQWVFEWGLAGFMALLGYLLVSLISLQRAKARLTVIYTGYKKSAYYWLLCVVLGLLLLVSVDLVFMALAYVQRAFMVEFIKVTNWIVATYLLAVAFFSVYRPEVFFHQAWRKSSADVSEDESSYGSPAGALDGEPTKSWRELDESLAQALSAELVVLMEQEEVYRQNDLSLAALAGRLGVTVHQASELLNVQMGANFYDYLNRYRLSYACKLLSDSQCQLRVLDIAFESGFSNKNSFYRYFREAYQMTPVDYRSRYSGAALKAVG